MKKVYNMKLFLPPNLYLTRANEAGKASKSARDAVLSDTMILFNRWRGKLATAG